MVVAGLAGFGIWQATRDTPGPDPREVEIFERTLFATMSPAQSVMAEMSTLPEQFLGEELPVEEYRGSAQQWVETLRSLNQDVVGFQVPEALEETRSLLVQGIVIYIDAAKAYLLAADLEGDTRATAVTQGRTLVSHGDAVFGMGLRALEELKLELGIIEEPSELLQQPYPLPPEDALPQVPPELLPEVPEGASPVPGESPLLEDE